MEFWNADSTRTLNHGICCRNQLSCCTVYIVYYIGKIQRNYTVQLSYRMKNIRYSILNQWKNSTERKWKKVISFPPTFSARKWICLIPFSPSKISTGRTWKKENPLVQYSIVHFTELEVMGTRLMSMPNCLCLRGETGE